MKISTSSQIHSAFVLSFAVSLSNRKSPFLAHSSMGFGVEISERIFSDVVQIQLNTNLDSRFTVL